MDAFQDLFYFVIKIFLLGCWILSWVVTLEISARRRSDKPVKNLTTWTTLHANRQERDENNVTNDDVFLETDIRRLRRYDS
jgi:hypothetical protein